MSAHDRNIQLKAVDHGVKLARIMFERLPPRIGGYSQIPLTEIELAACLALAYECGARSEDRRENK